MALNRTDRSISFTVRQPPKVLQASCVAHTSELASLFDYQGPEWQLAVDPTADTSLSHAAAFPGSDEDLDWDPAVDDAVDMGSSSFAGLAQMIRATCSALIRSGHSVALGDSAAGLRVGAGLAGAFGLLGRCMHFNIQLTAAAMQGGSAHDICGILQNAAETCWRMSLVNKQSISSLMLLVHNLHDSAPKERHDKVTTLFVCRHRHAGVESKTQCSCFRVLPRLLSVCLQMR